MGIKGSDEGVKKCNRLNTRTEPLITVEKLKKTYLFGISINDKAQNKDLPDETYQQYIDNAVSMIEHYLDIALMPARQVEYRDYILNEYVEWGYFQLNNLPVLEIESLKLTYHRDEDGEAITAFEIPLQWIRLQQHDGIIRLIPNTRFPGNLAIGASGSFFPEILRQSNAPHMWEITYTSGFDAGKIPTLVNQAIGLIAAIQALITGGSLVLGQGIASSSLSIDGLSQSINTTQSAENSANSAQVSEYYRLLLGKSEKEYQNSVMKMLKDYYCGNVMGFI